MTGRPKCANQPRDSKREGFFHMAEHKHGEMDATVHEATFNGFIKASTYVSGVAVLILIFLAIFNT
jgi:hypothetical protein